MKSLQQFILAILIPALFSSESLSSASLLARQSESETNYEGYTQEQCQGMFDSCKGHLAHPGHVPGGMKQCQFEMSEYCLTFLL